MNVYEIKYIYADGKYMKTIRVMADEVMGALKAVEKDSPYCAYRIDEITKLVSDVKLVRS